MILAAFFFDDIINELSMFIEDYLHSLIGFTCGQERGRGVHVAAFHNYDYGIGGTGFRMGYADRDGEGWG